MLNFTMRNPADSERGTAMLMLVEAHDAGRTLNVTPARVRQLVEEGKLVAAAKTPRGTHLFDPAVVEALRRLRARVRRELAPVPMSDATTRGHR